MDTRTERHLDGWTVGRRTVGKVDTSQREDTRTRGREDERTRGHKDEGTRRRGDAKTRGQKDGHRVDIRTDFRYRYRIASS